jgi:drug/metabolite transporter (DMT)-like permease
LSSKKVSHPALYAFYVGILDLFVLALIPFGFNWPGMFWALAYIFSGAIFLYGVLGVFFAINQSEVGRVTPVVGAVIPVVTCFMEYFLLENAFSRKEFLGIGFVILGGLLISFQLPFKLKQEKFFRGLYPALGAGFLLALAYLMFDYFYSREGNFFNVFIWTRLGLTGGALSLFIYSPWRKKILASLGGFKKEKEKNIQIGSLFVFNKVIGGVGSGMVNYAISLGSVTVVNALVSVQYVFVFLVGIIFARTFPRFFEEKHDWRSLLQKVVAIGIIGWGLALFF